MKPDMIIIGKGKPGKMSMEEEDEKGPGCKEALMDAVKAIKAGDNDAAVEALEAAIELKMLED